MSVESAQAQVVFSNQNHTIDQMIAGDMHSFNPVDASKESLAEQIEMCYKNIQDMMGYYMDVSPEVRALVPLWVIGTYFMPAFDTYPYLYFNAMRGSGKTRMLRFIAALAFGAENQVQSGITEAVLFRSPKYHTMLFDECENIASKEKAQLRQYLNASYKRGATVKRMKKVKKTDGEKFEVEEFQPYKPIAMANINGMDSVTQDRCITFILEKSSNPAYTKILEDFDHDEMLKTIKRTLLGVRVYGCRCTLEKQYNKLWNGYIKSKYLKDIYIHTSIQPYIHTSLHSPVTQQSDNTLNELFDKIESSNINGRNLELLFPLMSVALLVSQEFFFSILPFIEKLGSSKVQTEYEDDKDVSLIEYVSTLDAYRFQPISLSELKVGFRNFMSSFDETDRWLNETWLGIALKRLGLTGYRKRTKQGVMVMLTIENAKEKLKMFRKESDE